MAEVTVELWPLTNVWVEPRWHKSMARDFPGLARNSQSWVVNTLAQWHWGVTSPASCDEWRLRNLTNCSEGQNNLGENHSSSQYSDVKGLLFYHHGSVKQCWQMASHTFKYVTSANLVCFICLFHLVWLRHWCPQSGTKTIFRGD